MKIVREDCFLKDKCNHIDCEAFCLRNFKLNYLYESALIGVEQRKHHQIFCDNDGTDMEVFDTLGSIQKDIVNWVNSGSSLYIYSHQSGNGKSLWSLRLCQAYLNAIWFSSELKCRVLFISVPKLLSELKRNLSEESEYASYILDNINKADLVVWDDIAMQREGTDFEVNQLFSFIDNRICCGKANIYTSNLLPAELGGCLGTRLASRIANASTQLRFMGADKRSLGAYKGV